MRAKLGLLQQRHSESTWYSKGHVVIYVMIAAGSWYSGDGHLSKHINQRQYTDEDDIVQQYNSRPSTAQHDAE